MKKMFLTLIALLAITMSATAQENSTLGVFRGSNNTIGAQIMQGDEKSFTAGMGVQHQFSAENSRNVHIFALAGYKFKDIKFVAKAGSGTENNFVYGGFAEIQVSKRVGFMAGYDNNAMYTTGLTFKLY